jgi:phosphatidate cytidylyltransferase
MKNLVVRSISGLIYVVVVLACCFSGPSAQLFLACFLGAAGILEWQQFGEENKSTRAASFSIGILFLLNYTYSGVFELTDTTTRNLSFIAVFLFAILLLSQVFTRKKNVPGNLFHSVFGLVYIGFPMFLMPIIANFHESNDGWILASVFILIWISDSFAYLVGRRFGKRKLFERISPNKTIEGLLGGIVFTLIGSLALSYFVPIFSVTGWLGMAVIVLIFGTTGDLFESALKRSFKLKDSGNFMPGHGGILDRIDSLLMTLPIAYFYLRILEMI